MEQVGNGTRQVLSVYVTYNPYGLPLELEDSIYMNKAPTLTE